MCKELSAVPQPIREHTESVQSVEITLKSKSSVRQCSFGIDWDDWKCSEHSYNQSDTDTIGREWRLFECDVD